MLQPKVDFHGRMLYQTVVSQLQLLLDAALPNEDDVNDESML